MFELKKLPFEYDALEGFMSEELLKLHHGKHHQAYTDNFNKAVSENGLGGKSVSDIFAEVSKYPKAVENHGGGYFNHTFFWDGLSAEKKEISEELKAKLENSFGSFEEFVADFNTKAKTLFGSGWVFLVEGADGKLKNIQTFNQESPEMDFIVEREGENKPLLCLDVWEHAYYPDYQNRRPEYVEKFWDYVNWDEVGERLKS